MRRSIPEFIPMEPSEPIGDDGCREWHPEGADVPYQWLIAAVLVLATVLLLLLSMALAVRETNLPAGPGQSATPSPYGAPRGW